MILFKDPRLLAQYLDSVREKNVTIGFVPTMGALHMGHISLLEQCKNEAGLAVCSIFVNPTQFNDKKDYEKYPVTIEADIQKVESAGADILFFPMAADLYPDGTAHLEKYAIGYLETILEGKFRPGHFQGVCQVMHRLLRVVNPDKLFMGQKDYQQSLVIKHLLKSMNARTELIICPTLREENGLAMSSRNMRLSEDERKKAGIIYGTLHNIKQQLRPGRLSSLKNEASNLLTRNGFKIDYVEIANSNDLTILDEWDGRQPVSALAAVFINDVRLIDNMLIGPGT